MRMRQSSSSVASGFHTLSGYPDPFRLKDSTGVRTGRFRPGTSLTQVEAIWELDNRLRAAAFGPLQHVETYLRALLARSAAWYR